MKQTPIKLACVGAGYFAPFHLEAWKRIEQVDLVALCDKDREKGQKLARKFGIPTLYDEYQEMLDEQKPDVVDIITPPETHLSLCLEAARRGIHVICQKPLAPTQEEAEKLVEQMEKAEIRFMVHENFRFQPWYREIKRQLNQGALGDRIHYLHFRFRTGDGWPEDAYLDRQPYFRTMPRLLIYETGIHFIDTFRYLAGEVKQVYAVFRRLNPNIQGEDFALVQFEFENGALGLWDANRYNEADSLRPRFTFGDLLIEGSKGSLKLDMEGNLSTKKLSETMETVQYPLNDRNFAGDCVFATQEHFVNCFLKELPFETNGREYLKNIRIQEAIYESARKGLPVETLDADGTLMGR